MDSLPKGKEKEKMKLKNKTKEFGMVFIAIIVLLVMLTSCTLSKNPLTGFVVDENNNLSRRSKKRNKEEVSS